MTPLPVSAEDVAAAAERLSGVVIPTPCVYSPGLSELTGANVWVKYENMQATGSFKERGAYNRMAALTEAEGRAGVVTMSAGNHAQAVAYHAARLGIAATIVMPERTPFVKVAATEKHGATVVLSGETLYESAHRAREIAASGAILIPPFDDPLVIAGQGTVGREMLAAAPDLDTIVVPLGGGGLISGIATAVAGQGINVVGVEAKSYPSAYAALRGQTPRCGGTTLAEGIAVKAVGTLTLPIIRALVSDVLLVGESDLERAVYAYLTRQKTMAEGAGAAGLAALLAEPDRFSGRNVGLVLCGGNIDPRLAATIMVRELMRQRRIVSIEVRFTDEPGVLAKLTGAVASEGGNILEVLHNRLSLSHAAREASVRLTVETRDDDHTARVLAAMEGLGLDCRQSEAVDGRF